MIPLAKPDMGDEEIALVSDVIRSGWITQGPRVQEFETAFAARVGAGFGIATCNCTAALHIALLAADVGPGDEVIVTPHSFIATANAILYCGGRPVFVDIDPETLNMDPRLVEDAVTSRTKVILAVHQVGRPANLVELARIAAARGLKIVEDAACAIGSRYQGQPVGNNRHSALVCFSFHPRKVLSTGDGGMITTSDAALAKRLRMLRQHGMSVSDLDRHRSATVVTESYPILGFNYRMTDVQAAIGIAQLGRLDEIVGRRRALAAKYNSRLADIPGIECFAEPDDAGWNHQTYLVRLPKATAESRDAFMQRLLSDGISSRRGIMSIHREPCYERLLGRQSFPESERASDQCVCLPLYTQMTEADIDTVCDALRRNAPTL